MKNKNLMQTKLDKNEMVIMRNFAGLKSFARIEANLRVMSQIEMDEVYKSLEDKKLLKTSKNGAVKSVLEYEEINLLIGFNKNTRESAETSLNETTKSYTDALAHLETLPVEHVQWPNVSKRESYKNDTVSYIAKQKELKLKLFSLFC